VTGRIVLCGLGRVGWRVLDSLRAAGWEVVVVDLNADATDARLAGLRFIKGDCRNTNVLEQAEITTAHGVLIVTSNDLVNVGSALLIRRLNPTARIVVRMFNQNLLSRLGTAVHNTIALSVSALTAPFIALMALTGESLAAFKIGEQSQQIAELEITASSQLLREPIAHFADRAKLLVLARIPQSGKTDFLHEVDGTHRLEIGDRLVVCGSPNAIGPIINENDDSLANSVHWAGRLRVFFRMIRRVLGIVEWPILAATLVMFLTLFISTLVFRFGVGVSWADGLYETVSLVATGSELHGEGKEPWVKVFLGTMKILGAALVAAFTALFTNYLLKARLSGALETRRIPDRGHVVVCGLGNIGFRCIEELMRLGVQVVAIEKVSDSPFAATVRRMGAAVVIGDATVTEVLRQARADTARAVIAATSSELADLEIGLLVRELNPTQRIVVRLSDPDFAQAAREAADIKLAVSPPALAASAFAAALYGDRIQALAAVGHRSLAVLDFVLTKDDVLHLDRSLLELMIDYRFLPLGIAGQPSFAESGVPRSYRLKLGDVLTIALAIPDLERLLRRDAPPQIWRVMLDQFPVSAKAELNTLMRTARNCTMEEAEAILVALPCVFVESVSRGAAEEWFSRLTRERAESRIVQQ